MATQAAIVMPAIDLNMSVCATSPMQAGTTLTEANAKAALAACGLRIPRQRTTDSISDVDLSDMPFPVVLKGAGIAHKTEVGAVVLNLQDTQAIQTAAGAMRTSHFLIEEMVTGAVAELLIGIVKDPAHGFVLTIGAGGTLTELLQDSASILVPSSERSIKKALTKLRIYKVLLGYRGAPAANITAIVTAVMAIQDYVLANADHLQEIEINPLICTPDAAIAADALIRIVQ